VWSNCPSQTTNRSPIDEKNRQWLKPTTTTVSPMRRWKAATEAVHAPNLAECVYDSDDSAMMQQVIWDIVMRAIRVLTPTIQVLRNRELLAGVHVKELIDSI
jgi:hypothetical protein